jgi:tRNA A-37 threonylcarbamoyl transferase component Bud32
MADLRDQLQASLGSAYTIERELGGGGMSRVFLAEETRFHRKVVIKVLAPELAAGLSAERFEREIMVAARLQQANIVPLLTAGDVNGLPYFTMPFVDGESLRSRLASGESLALSECVSILRDVTRALAYAHEHGVIHRDIKPENVLLSRGAAEVTDFGIAKAIDAARTEAANPTLTQLGTSVGTPTYMSPEQAAGDPNIDKRADIYSLGVLGYEMLEGRPPFTGTPQAVMASHISITPPGITKRPEAPIELKRAIVKCLAKDPADRYQTADELLRDIEAVTTPSAGYPSAARPNRRRLLTLSAAAAAILAVVWLGTAGMRRERWARSEAIPQIKQFIDVAQYDSAWLLARRAEEVLPRDSTLRALWPRFTRKAVLHSNPEGAQVHRASFADTAHWILLGTTPTDTLLLPTEIGRVRVTKTGYQPQIGLMGSFSRTFFLDKVGAADSDMVHVPGGTFGSFLVGLEGVKPLALSDYLMDRHEVTNRQYKTFVDAGGYTKREYWPAEFVTNGKPISWDSAIHRFKDKTGRPGPATWEAGDYPSGQADFPVGGVSWYEASAYAKFAGKSLPTIFHWARAASIAAARYVVPGSNFNGSGPTRGSNWLGMSPYGVFDLAGNVREWSENSAGGDERFILGGGWSDPPYGFTDGYAQRAMDRDPINGIRLVKYLHDEPTLAQAKRGVTRAFRDYAREKPVPTALFDSYRHIFDYDRGPMNAKIEFRDTTPENWVMERVSFDAAYGNERMIANIFLPKGHPPPYQPVVYFPGSNVISVTSSTDGADLPPSFVVKAGRALILPILKSTYERRDSLHSDLPDSTIFWRDHAVMWVKDIRRTLDYLSTRPDMDTTRFSYFGLSWGSNMAPLSLATERRIKTAVLYVAGLTMERGRPEVDPLNYLPHVSIPVLMLNGKYDFFFPVEISQKPFFQMLGTPAEHKRYIVYEGGHDVPRTALISETLAWLDKYLGPAR